MGFFNTTSSWLVPVNQIFSASSNSALFAGNSQGPAASSLTLGEASGRVVSFSAVLDVRSQPASSGSTDYRAALAWTGSLDSRSQPAFSGSSEAAESAVLEDVVKRIPKKDDPRAQIPVTPKTQATRVRAAPWAHFNDADAKRIKVLLGQVQDTLGREVTRVRSAQERSSNPRDLLRLIVGTGVFSYIYGAQ